MLNTLIKNSIKNHDKIKKNKLFKQQEKLKKKMEMIRLFGKTRYYLAYWFGAWFLYTFNHRDYSPVLYEKFYRNLTTAYQYGEKLKEKYTRIKIIEVYNKDNIPVGYLLQGKDKEIEEIPSNVIPFSKQAKIQ